MPTRSRGHVPWLCGALLATLVAGCGGTGDLQSASPGTPSRSPSAAPTSADRTPVAAAPTRAWLEYGNGPARSLTGELGRTPQAAPAVRWQSPALQGAMHAQPLLFDGRLLAVTDADVVYALDPAGGAVLWQTALGTPRTTPVSDCASPALNGATGTPVIEADRGLLYVVTFIQPGIHQLDALDARTGALRWSVAIDPPGADPRELGNRGALGIANGMVYIPLGGRTGDCGFWHGWMVATPADGSAGLLSYQVPSTRWGGFWAPGGVTIAADGTLFAATGNGSEQEEGAPFNGSEAVMHFSAQLQLLDWWRPANVAGRDAADADVGSTSPVPVQGGTRLFQATKRGNAYLLDPGHLGNLGGDVGHVSICQDAVGAVGYSAVDNMVFIPCTSGLDAVRIGPGDTLTVAWHAGTAWPSSPLIANGTVWVVDVDTGLLHRYRAADGIPLGTLALGKTLHFDSLIATQGQVIVQAGSGVTAVSAG